MYALGKNVIYCLASQMLFSLLRTFCLLLC